MGREASIANIPASDCVAGIDPLDLEPGDLIEGAIILVKVSGPNGTSQMVHAATPGMSYWEQLGMLTDAAHGVQTAADWD